MPPKNGTPKPPAAETAASGRPKRSTAAPAAASAPPPATKKRAAPKKTAEPAPKRAKAAPKAKKAEDAPSKPEPATGAVEEESKAAPRKRGRPPKGGETTKATVLEEAAEQQLEDELLDDAAATTGSTAAGAEKKRAKGEPSLTTSKAVQSHGATEGKKNYWLMKAEQEDRLETAHDGTQINTKFTIDDLRENTVTKPGAKPELWDGVRNHVAANHMRAMRKGDLAFFYASGGKAGRSPGIVGTMEVVSEAEWDVTTEDPGMYGFVEEGKKEQRQKWVVVGVEFRSKLDAPVSLKKLQEFKDGRLAGMQLFRQSRLSVAKVTEEEWTFITDELVGR
ncbi:hypothetical protein LTR86_007786 [Recurvomyces mirabilis]|nr:hypothetical protein LTR86_007786 [Recurvomyces mirabilis]